MDAEEEEEDTNQPTVNGPPYSLTKRRCKICRGTIEESTGTKKTVLFGAEIDVHALPEYSSGINLKFRVQTTDLSPNVHFTKKYFASYFEFWIFIFQDEHMFFPMYMNVDYKGVTVWKNSSRSFFISPFATHPPTYSSQGDGRWQKRTAAPLSHILKKKKEKRPFFFSFFKWDTSLTRGTKMRHFL